MASAKPKETSQSIQILKASDVSIPIFPPTSSPEPVSPELAKLRADFLAGKEMTPEALRMMVRSSEGGGGSNGNCRIC